MMKRKRISLLSIILLTSTFFTIPKTFADDKNNKKFESQEIICGENDHFGKGSKKFALPERVLKRPPKLIELVTNCGVITIRPEFANAPKAVTFFVSLVQQDYFDETTCHRLTTDVTSFIQCGDPTGTGMGDKVYTYQKENLPRKSGRYREGSVAIQNRDGISSQFLLFYDDTTLAPNHAIWGRIIKGMDILEYIADGGVVGGGTDGTPTRNLIIKRAILR